MRPPTIEGIPRCQISRYRFSHQAEVEAKAEAQMRTVRSSLSLTLNLGLSSKDLTDDAAILP
jgi:hypothetical protein